MWDHLTFQHKPNLFYSQLACIQGLNTGISGKSFGMKWPLDLSNNVHFGKIIPVQLFFQVCAHRRHTLLTAYFVSNANESWIPKVDARHSNKSRAKTPAAYRQNLHFLKKPKPKSFHLYGFIFLWLLKKLSQFIFWCQKVTSGLEMARFDHLEWSEITYQTSGKTEPLPEQGRSHRAGLPQKTARTRSWRPEKRENFRSGRPWLLLTASLNVTLPSCQFHEECGLWSLPRSSPGRECGRTAPGEKDTSVIRTHLGNDVFEQRNS